MGIKTKLAELSRARTDSSATHGLLMWLDTLPPEIMITAEGRRRAGLSGEVTAAIPKYSSPSDDGSTAETQVESDARLARIYHDHPGMIWPEGEFSNG